MKNVKFEIGKVYVTPALYGGWLTIRVVDRTETTVSFVYTDDEENVETQEIVKQVFGAYGKNLEHLGDVESECTLAWTYQSPYAEPGDVDYGWFTAFDCDSLYTPEQFEEM